MAIVQPKDLPDDALLTGTERVPLQEAAGGPGSVKDCSIDQIKDFSIAALSGNVAAQAGDIAALQAGQSGLSGNVAAQAGDIAALQAGQSGLSGTVAGIQSDVSALQAGQSGLSGAVAGLQAAPPSHAASHEPGGSDPVTATPAAHAETHLAGEDNLLYSSEGAGTGEVEAGGFGGEAAWDFTNPAPKTIATATVSLRKTSFLPADAKLIIRDVHDGSVLAESDTISVGSESFFDAAFTFSPPVEVPAGACSLAIGIPAGTTVMVEVTDQASTPAVAELWRKPGTDPWALQSLAYPVATVGEAAAASDPISGEALAVDHTPTNYTPTNGTLSGHLAGLDAALGGIYGYQEIIIDPALAVDVVGKRYAALADALDWWQASGPAGVTVIQIPGVIDGAGAPYAFSGDHTGKYLVLQGAGRNLTTGTVTRINHILTVAPGPGPTAVNVRAIIQDAEVQEIQVSDQYSRFDLENVKINAQSAVGFARLRNVDLDGLNAIDAGIAGATGDVYLQGVRAFGLNLGGKIGTTVYAEGLTGVTVDQACLLSQPSGPGVDGEAVLGAGCHTRVQNGMALVTLRARQDVDGTTQQPDVLDWTGSTSTLSGLATFFPNVSGISGGIAMFTDFLDLQATAEHAGSTFADQVVANIKSGWTVGKVEIFAAKVGGAEWAPDGTRIRLRIKGVPA